MNCSITSFGRRETAVNSNCLPCPRLRPLNYFSVLFLLNWSKHLCIEISVLTCTSIFIPPSCCHVLQAGLFSLWLFLPNFLGNVLGSAEGQVRDQGCSRGTSTTFRTSLNPTEFHENMYLKGHGVTGPRELLQTARGRWRIGKEFFSERVRRGCDGIPREAMAASVSLSVSKARLDRSWKKPGRVEDVPAHGRGGTGFSLIQTQTIPGFYRF